MAEKDGNEVAATYKLSKIKLNNQVYDIGADWSNISNTPAFINPMTRAEVTEIVEGLYPNATSSEITEMVDDLLENYTDVNENLIEAILEEGNSSPVQYAPINSPALTGTPTAPTAAAGTDTTQIATTAFVQQEKFSGNYNDLTNKPTIPEAQVNSDWTATLGMAQILNKPSITSGIGTDSIIEGSSTYNIASGQYSHAEGSHTTASGPDAHAEGEYTTASNNASHAEGRNTIASGLYGHAEGCYTTASGSNSHSEGLYTVASKANQHVFGTYNIYEGGSASEKGVYVEVVGNGGTENTRSNARTLDWNGNEILSGKLTVGTAPTNNMDVTTKQYVDTALALKAPLASPALTGTPTAPTAAAGTSTTQIATTAFVNTNYYPKSGGSLNLNASLTLNKYDSRFVTIDGNGIAADMSAVDTWWAGAFAKVKDAANDETVMLGWYGSPTALQYIYMGGTLNDPAMKMTKAGLFTFKNAVTSTGGFVGDLTGIASKATADASGNTISTTYAKLASPAFTGTPTAPTAAANTNSTQIATTAFVKTLLSDIESALDDKLEEDDVYLASEAERHFMALTTIPSTDAAHVAQGQLYVNNDKLYWKTAAVPSTASAQIALIDTQTITLAVNDWNTTTKSQTVNVAGVTANNTVIVSTAPSSFENGMNAQIYCSAQGTGTLTFSYLGDLPSGTITMNILILD